MTECVCATLHAPFFIQLGHIAVGGGRKYGSGGEVGPGCVILGLSQGIKFLQSEKGIVFYPGGKVEETAYAPLLLELAEQGYEYVWVYTTNNYFNENMKELFGLKKVKDGNFYKVVRDDSGVKLEYMGKVQGK